MLSISVVTSRLLVGLLSQIPHFVSELWPEEGRPHFAVKHARTSLQTSPSKAATGPNLILRPGTEIAFDSTRYVTLRPGTLVARDSAVLTGRNLGKITYLSVHDYYSAPQSTTTVPILRGDQIEYLQYRAEGTCFIRVGGDVIDVDDCPHGSEHFQVLSEHILEWWIHVSMPNRMGGWLLVDSTNVALLKRTY
jgi:hypothetical protein